MIQQDRLLFSSLEEFRFHGRTFKRKHHKWGNQEWGNQEWGNQEWGNQEWGNQALKAEILSWVTRSHSIYRMRFKLWRRQARRPRIFLL